MCPTSNLLSTPRHVFWSWLNNDVVSLPFWFHINLWGVYLYFEPWQHLMLTMSSDVYTRKFDISNHNIIQNVLYFERHRRVTYCGLRTYWETGVVKKVCSHWIPNNMIKFQKDAFDCCKQMLTKYKRDASKHCKRWRIMYLCVWTGN